MLANGGWDLTFILLTWTIWRAPTNASKWRMGFNSAFKGLSHYPGIWLEFLMGHLNALLSSGWRERNEQEILKIALHFTPIHLSSLRPLFICSSMFIFIYSAPVCGSLYEFLPRTCETTWIRSTRLSQLNYGQQLRICKGLPRWLCVSGVSLET